LSLCPRAAKLKRLGASHPKPGLLVDVRISLFAAPGGRSALSNRAPEGALDSSCIL